MASLPPSQRRHSPPRRTNSDPEPPQPAIQRTNSEAQSTISEDSQTVLLNPSTVKPGAAKQEEGQKTAPAAPSPPQPEEEPRRCWICFTDETEDTPTSSEWRSPCPCALTAHESCLLDWIADMEAPNSRRQRSPNDKILCPQCKSEIFLARPRSYVVDTVRGLEIFTSKLVLPGVLTLGVSSFWYLCWVHGATSVLLVFGPHDGEEVLAPLLRRPPRSDSSIQALWHHIRQRWRLDMGLSLIPPMLVCSRVSIADGVLPILPMLFFVTKPDSDPLLDFGTWPPSASLSFALLPYIRSLYNTYYERVWAEKEKKWLKEIQPRATSEAQEGNEEQAEELNEEDNVLEINVDLAMLDEWDENDGEERLQQRQAQQLQIAPPLNAPPLDEVGAAPEMPGIPAVAPPPNVHQQHQGQQRPAQNPQQPNPLAQQGEPRNNFNLAVSTNRLAESILGALAFPAVSAATGELLRLALPKSWTTRAGSVYGGKPTGLLQARWGRSLVGGCMFVVLKDAVMLYVRWRMARDHRMRRVLDYDKKKRKTVPRQGTAEAGR